MSARLPVFAILKSSLAFAFDRAAWGATLRLAWVPLIVYAGLSLYEALNPPPQDAAFGSLEAVPWSAFALPFILAAAMRVRAFGVEARLSSARLLSLGGWALVWSVVLGAGFALVGLLIAAFGVAALALLPEAARAALLAPLRASPAAAATIAIVPAAIILLCLTIAFFRLYLIIPAAAADRAVNFRGAWALGRGNTWRLLGLAFIFLGGGEAVIGTAAETAAQIFQSAVVNTLLYNALALLTNQWAAASWIDIHRALSEEASEPAG